MKTAILTPTFMQFSGPDRVVENEAQELTGKGNEVTIFTFRSDIKPKGYEIEVLGMPSSPLLERAYRLFFFLDIFKIIKTSKKLQHYDEIISFLYPMTILAATAKKYYHKKYIYYNVGVAYPKLFRGLIERSYMKLFNFFTNMSIRSADTSISISNFLKEQLKKETGLDGSVKYVKVDQMKYNKAFSIKKVEELTKKHGLEKPVLLYVGRISPHKGVHLLLQAFRIVKEKIPTATLVIIGKHTFDSYSKELEKAAAAINKSSGRESVIFTGFVEEEEMPHYYHAADLYVTCTLWEGFDIPAVAAQMCGKEVVAFEVGSHPEVVKKGTLVKAGDVRALADAVIKLLEKKEE